MKKKIIVTLITSSLLSLVLGIYIIYKIDASTAKLDKIIELHQVEILREDLLLRIRKVQDDLYLKNTRHEHNVNTLVLHVDKMGKAVDICFTCHHNEFVSSKIRDLKSETETYKSALSRVWTIRADKKRLEEERENAFRTGEELIRHVDSMIVYTNSKLEWKTRAALIGVARTRIILTVLVLLFPMLMGFLSFVFIKGFTKPVDTLLQATERLKAGDLDFRINGLSDEFGRVAESFNSMAATLKNQMTRMQRTEQMVVYGHLAAGLAHEIKNPLAGIKVAMEVLSGELNQIPENRAMVEKILAEIRRLESLTRSLLDFARPPKPQLMDTDLNDIIESTLSFLLKQPSFSRTSPDPISVVRKLDSDLPQLTADPQQLRQVLMNLLLNAVDAMPNGGTLEIATWHDPFAEALVVTVSDTGEGIGPGAAGKMFTPFFTTKPKGTGLGLAITKQLVEQHGGTIAAGNRPSGGALFRIHLPLLHKMAEVLHG